MTAQFKDQVKNKKELKLKISQANLAQIKQKFKPSQPQSTVNVVTPKLDLLDAKVKKERKHRASLEKKQPSIQDQAKFFDLSSL